MNNKSTYILHARMFGKFSLSDGQTEMDKEYLRSQMLIRLLGYLIVGRNRPLLVQDLSENLWEEDESDNPVGALKNLMYRLRTILNKTFGEREYILTVPGGYQWNPDITLALDVEAFETHTSQIIASGRDDEVIANGREMLKLYSGKFLPELSDRYWVISKSTYYHSLFLSAGRKYAEALIANKLFDEAEAACQRAIEIDTYEEEIHVMLIRTLLGKNKQQLALQHYQETVELLYDALGVKPSGELLALYADIRKREYEVEENIGVLQEKLIDTNWTRGPLFAEIGTFKELYTFMSHSGARLGMAVQLALVTLDTKEHLETGETQYQELIRYGMGTLRDVMAARLRTNDIVCRFSHSQYLVLLTACQYEAGRTVMERIKEGFEHVERKMRLLIKYKLDEIALQNA